MKTAANLGVEIPERLAEELLKRIPYVCEGIRNARVLPGGREVAFDLLEGFETRASEVAGAIADIAAKLTQDHRVLSFRTIAKRDAFPSDFAEDPHPLLEACGELIPLGRGRYAYGPRVVALMSVFESRIAQMAAAFTAPSFAFPSLIGADALDRCQYFRNFPTSLSFVSHLREDHASIREFTKTARWEDGKGHLQFDHSSLSSVECVLAPSVCFHWYACLAGTAVTTRAVTAVGKCFRYESSNLSGLERLWDFTMREVMFAGTPDYVRSRREACLEQSVEFLDELNLAYEVTTATDPFFADAYAAQAAYQQGFELKFELLVPLPYSRRKLAVGSINYHQDFFGRSFAIEAGGGYAHTGCIGFGLERLALAFLAQHGLDERRWPRWLSRG